jgi:prepilin-type N-terminal cleavage/methylation domain-containing protein/prepilin-type processing-associated H-X9-DG protein
MPYRSFQRRAFTILELLIVLGIVAVLAAFIFPVFARARQNARRASCQTHLKQIGLGMMQYSRDYDEKMPLSLTEQGETWVDIIHPYIKSDAVFLCPNDLTPFPLNNLHRRRTSYALNQLYAHIPRERLFGIPGSGPRSIGMVKIKAPAATIAAGDSSDYLQVTMAPRSTTVALSLNAAPPYFGDGGKHGRFAGRHLEGANWLYLDGHVKWHLLNNITQLSAKKQYRHFTHAID